MTTPFLEKAAKHLYEKYGEGISDICIVLPNRRGGLFFRKYLAKLLSKPAWAPKVISSEDFVVLLSGLQVVDNTDLFFHLYEIHLAIKGKEAEPFGDFTRWAHILLNDFNEVDQYLVDASALYKNLKQVKEIENWSLNADDLTEFQQQYLLFWDTLGIYYSELQKKLLSLKQAYPGMVYRSVAADIENKIAQQPWAKIVFAGFNAMNKAEEEIISALLKLGKAELLWDTDAYYMNNKVQEAGKFLRKYRNVFPFATGIPQGKEATKPVFTWEENLLAVSPKKIHCIGAAGNVAQAALSGNLVQEILGEGFSADETALVLADEGLLFPVLHSLPASVKEVNVTMGYPLRNTPVAGLINALFNLQENKRGSGKTVSFYHRDVLKVLSHPFVSMLLTDSPEKGRAMLLSRLISRKNYIFITQQELTNLAVESGGEDTHGLLSIFSEWKTIEGALDKLLLLLGDIAEKINHGEEEEEGRIKKGKLEEEYISAVSRIVRRMKDLSASCNYINSTKTLGLLIRQMIRGVSLPFYGEPLAGLQVMGMLETRTLDFRNIILLSANENVLPSPRTQNTFIPFDIKNAYGLPVYRDKDAVFAYHFYRLLQRAENIYLVYNTEPDLFGSGEKSRFITQLIHELPKINPNIRLEEKFLSSSLGAIKKNIAITVDKTEDVMKKLKEKAHSGFSPTVLISYINCRLQFYFKTVAGLEEAEEIEETIGADVLGIAIHQVLQELYTPYLAKNSTAEQVKSMMPLAEDALRKALGKYYNERELSYGKNLLVYRVARQFILTYLENEVKFLEKSSKNTGIYIEGLETRMSTEKQVGTQKVVLKGTADRIDKLVSSEGRATLRVIDYKTGKVDNQEIKIEVIDELLTSNKHNKSFQLLMYAWLYSKQNPDVPLMAGIVTFKELSAGVKYLKIGGKDLLDKNVFSQFDALIEQLLASILDVSIPFTQTSNIKNCEYCSFKMICNK